MISFDALNACVSRQWSPEIGDPSVVGWLTVLAYGITAILGFSAARKSGDRIVRLFWIALTMLLVALMFNKQLDLQSALTAAARCLSQMQGWYEDRRVVQLLFILAIAVLGLMIGLLSLWGLRQHLGQIGIALIGFIFLICFVLIRAAGFHNFDALINADFMSIRMNWLLELSGLALISINAIWALRKY